jgi:hypothetical protein
VNDREQREAHVAAARRASRRFSAWLWAGGVPAVVLTFGSLVRRSGPDAILQGCVAVLFVVTAVAARREWRTIARHRAALAAWAVETSWSGAPVLGPTAVGGQFAAAARAALRTHALVVIACTALLAVTAAAWIWTATSSIGPGSPTLGPSTFGMLLTAAVLGAWSQVKVSRVEAASPRGRLDRRPGQAGVVLFAVALAACGIWVMSLRVARLDAEPPRLVTATITECVVKSKERTCTGRWEVDGRVYSQPVPFQLVREGEVLQFEVAASRPDLVLPQQISPAVRYAPVFGSVAVVAAAVWWLRCARSLRRALRRAAARPDQAVGGCGSPTS